MKELHGQIQGVNDIYKAVPLSEEQVMMEGMDLDLTFLDDFVQSEA